MILATTGHRPDKLIGGYDGYFPILTSYNRWFLTRNRPTKGISGMALGQDMCFAQACIDLEIPFIAAVPFVGQERKWPKASQDLYNELMSRAESIVVVSPGAYSVPKMYKRNEWMVDECTTLFAMWNGTSGGTGHCVAYAQRKGVNIHNGWQRYATKGKSLT